MDLSPALIAAVELALVALLIGVGLFALRRFAPAWVVTLIQERLDAIAAELSENTTLTAQVRDASDTRLMSVVEDMQRYRVIAERLQRLLAELHANPEARPFVTQAATAVQAIEHDPAWADLVDTLVTNLIFPAHPEPAPPVTEPGA